MRNQTTKKPARTASKRGTFLVAIATVCYLALTCGTTAYAQSVHEITIATPDMIAVEVRDAPFTPGRIEALSAPSSETQGTWIRSGNGWGQVIGPERKHVRISDKPPAVYSDLARLDDAASYGEIAGRKVISVYRKSVPYDSGIYRGNGGETMTGASMKHYLYLQLSGRLPEGKHIIRWPSAAFPETNFEYSSKHTRAIALRSNQLGFRAADIGKIAYLSLWLPGAPSHGAVDFRKFGVGTFDIIDEAGQSRFSSTMTLRQAPTDPEPGNGFPTSLLEYPDLSQTGLGVSRIEPRSPLTLVVPKHRLVVGQRVWLDGFSGTQVAYNGFATLAAVAGDRIELAGMPSGNTAPVSSTPLLYPIHQANRAATFVFQLDFGAWQPQAKGRYRIHVPGLGVSDPFDIRDDIWLQAGRTAIGGLYNHRSGIALDGRFGFTRPVSFKPGPSLSIQLSKLPLSWTSNAPTGFINADEGGKSPWITAEIAPDTYWGGYMDAGDWDRRIDHVSVSMLLMDVYEAFPAAAQSTGLGIPKSSELLDSALYAGTDNLPDILHEAIWTLDFFRRLQLPDGSVRGGIESSAHPLLSVPSFLEHLTVFAYAPDPISTYRYAAGAAKLAGIMQRAGQSRLSDIYRESALKAWQWAEDAFNNTDTHAVEAKDIAAKSGVFSKVEWETRAAALKKAMTEHRITAAAAMFRLTGESAYGTIFERAWIRKIELYEHIADGAWDYYRAEGPTANKALQESIGARFVSAALIVANAQSKLNYSSMKHPFAPIGWGQGLAPDYNQAQMFIRAHQVSKNPLLLKTMQQASAHILGANQVGLSFTTGLGLRNVKHPLHEDHRAMGVKAPDGITIYGWAPQSATSHNWIFGPFWSPLPVSGERENAHSRNVLPNRFAMPFFEYLIEHPQLVMQQEYTVHQSIGTTASIWLYLHAAGGSRAMSDE